MTAVEKRFFAKRMIPYYLLILALLIVTAVANVYYNFSFSMLATSFCSYPFFTALMFWIAMYNGDLDYEKHPVLMLSLFLLLFPIVLGVLRVILEVK